MFDDLDISAESIQSASTLMLSHYNDPTQITSEWNSKVSNLSTPISSLLPLLYVANDVLQTSKRKKGNNFLESFSPILSFALTTMCRRCGSLPLTEKIRRTCKIWGERAVFSPRFVEELLDKIEPIRKRHQNGDFESTDPSSSDDESSSSAPTLAPALAPTPSNNSSSPSAGGTFNVLLPSTNISDDNNTDNFSKKRKANSNSNSNSNDSDNDEDPFNPFSDNDITSLSSNLNDNSMELEDLLQAKKTYHLKMLNNQLIMLPKELKEYDPLFVSNIDGEDELVEKVSWIGLEGGCVCCKNH